jgi:hypothetical protein
MGPRPHSRVTGNVSEGQSPASFAGAVGGREGRVLALANGAWGMVGSAT